MASDARKQALIEAAAILRARADRGLDNAGTYSQGLADAEAILIAFSEGRPCV